MTRTPRVTVLTCSYDRASYLGRLYASLREQTFTDFEWLVVDDGSSDDTRDVVAALAASAPFPVRYAWQPNGGKHRALNTGVRLASGEFVAVIDSDDWYEPEALARFVQAWDGLGDDAGRFAEVSALGIRPDGSLIGSAFPHDGFAASAFDLKYVHGVTGDKVGMFRRDVLVRFPFPTFGRAVVTEGIVWNRIARDHLTLGINVPLSRKDYLEGGLSDATASETARRQARPLTVFYRELAALGTRQPRRWQMWCHANWVRACVHAHGNLWGELRRAPVASRFGLAIPIGLALALRDVARTSRRSLAPPA